MRIFFRVDASAKIGSGHQMRCLTLANELKQRGAKVEFIMRESLGEINFPLHKLTSRGENENYCPHASWLEAAWQDDAKETAKLVKGADWLLVDHYALDFRWEEFVKPHVKKILILDDLDDRKHSADLLLDQNYYKNAKARYKNFSGEKLLGTNYALLRPEFLLARKTRKQSDKIKKIFVCFGGVDASDETGKAIAALKNFAGEIIVVVGNSYAHYEKLKANKKIRLYKNVNNIVELMAEADIAIGAGGSTTWERASLGLPTLAWAIADNQENILYDMDKLGALKLTNPENLNFDFDLKKMSQIAFNLCDGLGAKRVANHILLNLRPASINDSETIFQIRNKKEVRENSFHSQKISFKEHQNWFAESLKNSRRNIFVAELAGKIIGVLRYDTTGSAAEVSVYLDPDYFGKGYGETILEKGESWIKKNNIATELTAKILQDNLKSQNLFSKLGFTEKSGIYRKKL